MEFLTFHVTLASESEAHPNQTLRHKEYMAMIDMMFASARLTEHVLRTVVLTDNITDFGLCRTRIDTIVRTEINANRLMMERTRSQLSYVESSAFTAPIVILDSDILINSTLKPIFNIDFDVALTWRESKSQPINGGFLILNNLRPDVSRRFFQKFSAIYCERYADQAAWYGDQLALRDCVGLSIKEFRKRTLIEVDGCRILLLPCDSHNFSPENKYAEIRADRPEKVVIHFKGERKRLMASYWYAWLKPRKSYSPFVHLRAWQERKSLVRLVQSETVVLQPENKESNYDGKVS